MAVAAGFALSTTGRFSAVHRGRSEADTRRDHENWSEAEQTEAYKMPNIALWTTVSGFESLPPSQV